MSSDSEAPFRDDLEVVDSVIVGGGIAGLSAALFLARAGGSTIVYDAGCSRIFAVERVHEFVGFDGWTQEEMLTKVREEVLRYGAQIRSGIVTKVDSRSDGLLMSLCACSSKPITDVLHKLVRPYPLPGIATLLAQNERIPEAAGLCFPIRTPRRNTHVQGTTADADGSIRGRIPSLQAALSRRQARLRLHSISLAVSSGR